MKRCLTLLCIPISFISGILFPEHKFAGLKIVCLIFAIGDVFYYFGVGILLNRKVQRSSPVKSYGQDELRHLPDPYQILT